MAGSVKIDTERCKGCSLCVWACPKGCLSISTFSNSKGFFPAKTGDLSQCSGCTICAIICPDAIIEVERQETVTVGPVKKDVQTLIGKNRE